MKARLRWTDELGIQHLVELDRPMFTIGRKAENDLQLLDRTISRQHAEIVQEDGKFILRDKNSKYGTFLNGTQIQESELHAGDEVRIGQSHTLQFLFEGTTAIFRPEARSSRQLLQQMSRFLEIGKLFQAFPTLDEVLATVLDAAIEIAESERGYIMLVDEEGQLQFRLGRDRNRRALSGDVFPPSSSILAEAQKTGRPVYVENALADSRFAHETSVRQMELKSVVCLPLEEAPEDVPRDLTMAWKPRMIGVLYLDKTHAPGTRPALETPLLEGLAAEAVRSIEHARLLQESEERKRLQRELALAREIQEALLPRSFGDYRFFRAEGFCIPSRHVGGDYFDLVALDDGRYAFIIADVAGKGVSAALLAAMLQGSLHSQLVLAREPEQIVSELNRLLVSRSASSQFVTLVLGILDTAGRIDYVNAGHNPPLKLASQGPRFLTEGDLVVGAFDFARYERQQLQLEPGESLVLYTDGVTESAAPSGDLFGEERLEELVRGKPGVDPAQLVESVRTALARFTRNEPQGDDMTLLAIQYTGPKP
ncbi:MAG: SpoIIE family protein phosphatase [Acidobacteria bacterium]|nr:SpoIIE family protein phosphatase [Acidobacteriota bacterium]